MDAEFFERLYRSYLGEHLISGELFSRGLEVFRLPADFGFDLVVTNQFRASRGNLEDASAFPFSLQVKSRWVKSEEVKDGPNNRPETEFFYRLKQSELDLFARHGNSAVAFVFHIVRPERSQPARYFLIHSRDFPVLQKQGFLRPAHGGGYELSVRFRDVPRGKRDSFVEDLLSSKQLTKKGANSLKKILPDSFKLQWNAKPYFQFAHAPREDKGLVWRKVELCTDLAEFPRIPTFRFTKR